MNYIILGVCAFLTIYFFDLAALKKSRFFKFVLGGVPIILFIIALRGVYTYASRFHLPEWTLYLGYFLLPLASYLMYLSLIREIHPREAYFSESHGNQLVKTGTYALVRHPGVLWFTLFLLALLLISRSQILLLAAPIWIAMDILYILIQDRLYFPRMFPGYEQYRKETPLLIPTKKSLGRFLTTMFRKDKQQK